MPDNILADMNRTPIVVWVTHATLQCYLWLASDEAAYVHGATISVDG